MQKQTKKKIKSGKIFSIIEIIVGTIPILWPQTALLSPTHLVGRAGQGGADIGLVS